MKKQFTMSDSAKAKYAELFTAAIDSMEAAEWQKPWVSPNLGVPCNLYRKGKPYRRTNAFLLMMLCQLRGWNTPYFVTKSQMQDEGLKYGGLTANREVMVDEAGLPVFDDKGLPVMLVEKRFPVVFFKPYHRDKDGNKLTDEEYDDLSATEKAECRTWFLQQWYQVMNLDQTDFRQRYPDDYQAMTEVRGHEYQHGRKDDTLERMITGGEWRCPIHFGGMSAHYNPQDDHIRLPERDKFKSDELFYATALHEMAHSTARELGRTQDGSFGSEEYAMEEFVAELTSACCCSMLGIGKLLDSQHVAYVQNWRTALHTQKDFIPTVIDQVQRAVNYILNRYQQAAQGASAPLLLAA